MAATALDTSNLTVMTGQAVPLSGLAVEISANAKAGNSRFEIRLDPPDLGRIDVRLDVDRNGQVTSRLFVEKSETLDLLRRDAPQLQQALQDAGLKTSDSGLQFSLRDQNPQQGQSNSNGGSQNPQRLVDCRGRRGCYRECCRPQLCAVTKHGRRCRHQGMREA